MAGLKLIRLSEGLDAQSGGIAPNVQTMSVPEFCVPEFCFHGARTAITWSRNKQTPLAQWVNPMVVRRGMKKTVVALANKTARIGWLIVARGEHYDVNKLPV
jgi:hypothetical protein